MGTHYRDMIVNLENPRSARDRTAVAIIDALQNGPLLSRDLRAAIVAAGEDPRFQPSAMKSLHNLGFVIDCTKARHKSEWTLVPTAKETEDARRRRVSEGYSVAVTTARMFAGQLRTAPGDPIAVNSHRRAVQTAIDHGTDLGMSIQEVVDDCEPLTVP